MLGRTTPVGLIVLMGTVLCTAPAAAQRIHAPAPGGESLVAIVPGSAPVPYPPLDPSGFALREVSEPRLPGLDERLAEPLATEAEQRSSLDGAFSGVWVGAAIGAAVGAGWGVFILSEEPDSPVFGPAATVGIPAALGAVGGGVLGAIIGLLDNGPPRRVSNGAAAGAR